MNHSVGSPITGGNDHTKTMGGNPFSDILGAATGASTDGSKTGGRRRRSGKKSKKGKKSRGGKKRGRKSRKSRKR